MPIQYQADYRTLRDFAQPEIISMIKRMTDITTLADLMDKRKANQMTIAAAEKKSSAQEALSAGAQEQLTKYQTEPVIGQKPQAPVEPAALPAPAPEPAKSAIDTSKDIYAQIQNSLISPESDQVIQAGPPDLRQHSKDVSDFYKQKGLNIPPRVVDKILGGKMTYEEFLASDETPGLMAWDKMRYKSADEETAAINAKKQAEYQAQVDAQKAAYEAQQAQYGQQKSAYQTQVAAATPEARIPEEFRFMSPNQYQTYLKAMVEQPEVAEDFKKSIIESKKTLAEAGTQEAKSKDLKDYQIGSILNTAWKKGQGAEANEALVQGLISMGYGPVEARSAVDNAEALVAKYQSSPAMLGLGKLKATAEAQQEKFEFEAKKEEFKQLMASRKDAREERKEAREARKQAIKEGEAETKKRDYVTSVERDLTNKKAAAQKMYEELANSPRATGKLADTWASMWSSNEAADRRRDLNKIKNGLGFGALVDFRKQGVTFGALSEREYDRAASAATKLSFDASVKNNLEALQEYIDALDNSLTNLPDKGEYRPAIKSAKKGGKVTKVGDYTVEEME